MNDELIERLKLIEALLGQFLSIPQKPFVKTKEACEYLSVCENTLKKICAANGIKPLEVKGSGSNYYRIRDLESLFTEGRQN